MWLLRTKCKGVLELFALTQLRDDFSVLVSSPRLWLFFGTNAWILEDVSIDEERCLFSSQCDVATSGSSEWWGVKLRNETEVPLTLLLNCPRARLTTTSRLPITILATLSNSSSWRSGCALPPLLGGDASIRGLVGIFTLVTLVLRLTPKTIAEYRLDSFKKNKAVFTGDLVTIHRYGPVLLITNTTMFPCILISGCGIAIVSVQLAISKVLNPKFDGLALKKASHS